MPDFDDPDDYMPEPPAFAFEADAPDYFPDAPPPSEESAPMPVRRAKRGRPMRSEAEAETPAVDGNAPQRAADCADLNAERAVIAVCLTYPESIAIVQSRLQALDFYDPRHVAVFEAMCAVSLRGTAADLVTVQAELARMGQADAVPLRYLIELTQQPGSPHVVESYARRIAELGNARRVLQAANRIAWDVTQAHADPKAFVEAAASAFDAAVQPSVTGEIQHIGAVGQQVFADLLERMRLGGRLLGVPTGFAAVDRLHMGLHATDLTILAARPAMGKSAFAMNLAYNVGKRPSRHDQTRKARVAVFSLEMGREQVTQRILASSAFVPLQALREGKLSPQQVDRLERAVADLAGLDLHIDDTAALTIADLRARCRKLELAGKLDLVVVDYLQLMRGTKRTSSREQEVAEVSRGLKELAKSLRCTVLALSQLNRTLERRDSKRPMMSDLRESGSIEQDADNIWFIHREHYFTPAAPPSEAVLIVAKHRAGETGDIYLHFDGSLTRFTGMQEQP